MSEQEQNLTRVRDNIGDIVIKFVHGRAGQEFSAADLRRFVDYQYGPVAPGSPDRILRDLRQRGFINYVVVNRKQSLYLAGSR